MKRTVSTRKMDFFSFSLIILMSILFPINYELFFSLRPADVCLVLFIVTSFVKNKFFVANKYAWGWFFVFLLTLSLLWGLLMLETKNYYNFIFYFKYLIVIFFFMAFSSNVLDFQQCKIIYYVLLFCFISLVIYSCIFSFYTFFRYRLAFPFTISRTGRTDAHLFSSVVAMHAVFLFLSTGYFIRKKYLMIFIKIFSLFAAFLLVALSGSRTGMLILFIFLMYRTVIFFMQIICLKKKMRLLNVCVMCFCLSMFVFLIPLFVNGASRIVQRAFSFSTDQSVQARLLKTTIALTAVVENGTVLGIGMLSFRESWFDSGFASLCVNLGFIGFLTFAIYVFIFFIKKSRKNSGNYVGFYVAIYVFMNIITEYFLVFRSLIPYGVMLCLLLSLNAKIVFLEPPARRSESLLLALTQARKLKATSPERSGSAL